MSFCTKCMSEFEGKTNKDGFCLACDEAIKRGKAQTAKIKSGKLKTAEEPKKKK